MSFAVRILADSVGETGKRLTTWLATYPRNVHDELLTHKMLSKNSASSRAIPTPRLIDMIESDPFIPMYIGQNQKGMQAGEELSEANRQVAVDAWIGLRDQAVRAARVMLELKVHKQVINRALQPWMWITVVISGTETTNFFGLRDHPAAEPHLQHVTRMMRDARDASTPKVLKPGEWHLPFIDPELDGVAAREWLARSSTEWATDRATKAEIDYMVNQVLAKVSVGRTARVSYLTHDGKRDISEDIRLHDDLMVKRPLHASPAEHVAQAMGWPTWFYPSGPLAGATLDHYQAEYFRLLEEDTGAPNRFERLQLLALLLRQMQSGNFYGFCQYRKLFVDENIGGRMP